MNTSPEGSADLVRIRPLQPSDIDAVMQLHRELGWNPAFKADGTTLRQRLAAVITEENSLLLVAERGDTVAGYIHGEILSYLLFAGREMLITEVFVHKGARGKGIGTALMQAMEQQAVNRRCFRISVLNSRERESYRRGFYPSLGYNERSQVVNFVKRLDFG